IFDERKVSRARQSCRGQHDRRHIIEELVLQKPGNIDGRSAQENAAPATLEPINKLLVGARDDEMEIKTDLPEAAYDVFDLGRFLLQRIQRRFQSLESSIECDVSITQRSSFHFSITVLARKSARHKREARLFSAAFSKAHPKLICKPL